VSTDSTVFSVRQLAEHWQVSERHVYNLVASNMVLMMKPPAAPVDVRTGSERKLT